MLENRRHFRVRELLDTHWAIPGRDAIGKGKIYNVSASGVLFQTEGFFKIPERFVLIIDTPIGPIVTKKTKVVWFRRVQIPMQGYLCGLEFTDLHDPKLRAWLQQRLDQFAQAEDARIVNNYINSGGV